MTTTAKQLIEDTARELGLTMTAEFVPFSKSSSAREKSPNLNWKVRLAKGGRLILTTDYSAGCAHCPSYQQRATVDSAAFVKQECETGKRAKSDRKGVDDLQWGAPIQPELADVLHSLASDSDVLDCGSFEEWAGNLGYDTDSRKAEAIYRACLEIALKLRNALGEDGLAKLREAAQDY